MGIIRKLLTGLIVVAAVAGLIGFAMPQHAGLERSVHIDVPPANVFAVLNGFRNFDKWSPWADIDPAVKVGFEGAISGVGAGYRWSGNAKVGSGSQEIALSRPNSDIVLRLMFGDSGRPNQAAFHIVPEGQGSLVTWHFDADMGLNPYARLMTPLMRHFVGQDYERGLARLKVFVEGLPRTDLTGLDARLEPLNAIPYVYVKRSCTTDAAEISRSIAAAFAEVHAGLQKQNIQPSGAALAITRRWDDAAKIYEFEAGFPVDAAVSTVGEGLLLGKTYAGLAVHVEFHGAYSGIKHAYEQIDAYDRAYGLQSNGDVWEQYPNDPATTPPAELVTFIEVPVK
jgi:effector-binding domain-containing protein